MLSYIFTGMIVISVICGAITGKMEAVSAAALTGAADAIELILSIGGMMLLWSGLMELCEKSGLVRGFAKAVSPLLRILFPDLKGNEKAKSAIAMNMAANVLGLSNAATPLGLRAMEELQKVSTEGDKATRSMSMLVIINTASIQLIPSTVAALRAAAGAKNPFDVLPAVWATSFLVLCIGVLMFKLLSGRQKGRKKSC